MRELRAQAAAAQAEQRSEAWLPVAAALASWLEQAKSSQRAEADLADVRKAIDWLRKAGQEIRDDRMAQLTKTSAEVWTAAVVVAESHAAGVDVEGELEAIRRVEEGATDAAEVYSVDTAVEFVRATGVDCFAPAIGNAHGLYEREPELDSERVTAIVDKVAVPIALHGGTGMSQAQFDDLISRGCAKVNISTALKIAYVDAHRDYLARFPGRYDPPDLFRYVHRAVQDMALDHIRRLGGEGRAC